MPNPKPNKILFASGAILLTVVVGYWCWFGIQGQMSSVSMVSVLPCLFAYVLLSWSRVETSTVRLVAVLMSTLVVVIAIGFWAPI